MHSERDYIKKYVIPKLRYELYPYGITIDIIDLRWGVDTTDEDEDSRESKVLNVCFEAIRKGRPYFIGLLGNRYGWIPPEILKQNLARSMTENEYNRMRCYNGRSVTELEMIYGALLSKENLQHSYFFFRDDDIYAKIPEDYRDIYIETDAERQNKIISLKHQILSTFIKYSKENNIYTYSVEWDKQRNQITSLSKFGSSIIDALKNDILANLDISRPITEEDYEDKTFDLFVHHHTIEFYGRRNVIDNILSHLLNYSISDDSNGLFLIGPSGFGKSAVFCKSYTELRDQPYDDIIILTHAAGITASSRNPQNMVKYWAHKLEQYVDISSGFMNSQNEDLYDKFNRLATLLNYRGYSIIILIDSYDNLDFEENRDCRNNPQFTSSLSFIPKFIPFICTSTPEYVLHHIPSYCRYRNIELNAFSYNEASCFINEKLRSQLKELPEDCIRTILSKKNADGLFSYSSPLWLKIALSILSELGNKNFIEINREKFIRDDIKIKSYISKLLDRMDPSVDGLFQQYINLACDFFCEELVLTTLISCAISSTGVATSEIALLCKGCWDELEFESFTLWANEFFKQNPVSGRWSLNHDILKKVAQNFDHIFRQKIQADYIRVLLNNKDSLESVNELLYQCIFSYDGNSFLRIPEILAAHSKQISYIAEQLINYGLSVAQFESFMTAVLKQVSGSIEALEIFLSISESLEPKDKDYPHRVRLYDVLLNMISITNQNATTVVGIICRIFSTKMNIADDMRLYNQCEMLYQDFNRLLTHYAKDYGIQCINELYFYEILDIYQVYISIPYKKKFIWHTSTYDELAEEGVRRTIAVVELIKKLIDSGIRREVELIDMVIQRFEPKTDYFYSDKQKLQIISALSLLKPDYIIQESDDSHISFDFSEYILKYEEEKKRDVEQFEQILSSISDTNILALIGYIRTNISNRSSDDLRRLVELVIKQADILITADDSLNAVNLINVTYRIILSQFFNYEEIYTQENRQESIRYKVSKKHVIPIYSLVEWFASNELIDYAVNILETLYYKRRIKYAFYPFQDGAMFIINLLITVYGNLNLNDKAADLMEEYYEFILRSPMPPEDTKIHPMNEYNNLIAILERCGRQNHLKTLKNRIDGWQNFNYRTVKSKDMKYRYCLGNLSIVGKPGQVGDSYKWGYEYNDGTLVIPHIFDEATFFNDGLAMVGIGDSNKETGYGIYGMKYGYINQKGEIAIPIEYDYASAFYDGEALVSKNNDFYYIDINGKTTRTINF